MRAAKTTRKGAEKMSGLMNTEDENFWCTCFGTLILVLGPRPKILPIRHNPGLQGFGLLFSKGDGC